MSDVSYVSGQGERNERHAVVRHVILQLFLGCRGGKYRANREQRHCADKEEKIKQGVHGHILQFICLLEGDIDGKVSELMARHQPDHHDTKERQTQYRLLLAPQFLQRRTDIDLNATVITALGAVKAHHALCVRRKRCGISEHGATRGLGCAFEA